MDLSKNEKRWFSKIQVELEKIKYGSVTIELHKKNGRVVHANIVNKKTIKF